MRSPAKVLLRLTACGFFTVLAFALSPPAAAGQAARFRRGDSNGDARLDLSDSVFSLASLFLGGAPTACLDAADANDDGTLDISDPLFTLIHLFLGGSAPPAPGLACGEDGTADDLDCARYAPCEVVDGPSDFVTPLAGGPGFFGPGREADDGAVPGAPPAADPGAAPAPERLIEESDIYKLEGTDLFVLNRYRGLQVIDLADLDRPRLIGRAPIYGWPKEMYVRGPLAYVIVSDYYTFWRDDAVASSAYGFHGSQVRLVDVSDPRAPRVVGGIDIEGDITDSRIVGDVLYVVSQRYPWWGGFDTTDAADMTQVVSISIADPSNVFVVERKDFPRNGWEHHITATPRAIYLASSGWVPDVDWRGQYETRIRYIDISDPAGAIVIRGEASVPGRVQDRWSMDEHEGVLRVASGQSWGNGDVYLTTLSVSDPDRIRQLGRYTLHVNENLTAARFDGPRGYLVSYRNIDPLFTFDLSDPARPRLLGELEMTGWLDFIVPMGDRLVALGHEDLQSPDGSRDISLAVSLIDVGQGTAPKLLSRVALDGAWGWVPGDRDDFAKVFRTLPGRGLILFPFQAWSRGDYRYIGGVQLIDFDRGSLTLRGLIRDAGWVERGIPYSEDTVLTLSSEVFQVVDIADRDRPRVRGRLELARNVQDFAPLPGGELAVQLSGDWWRGDTQLTVTPLLDPDTAEPVSRVHVGAPYGRMFTNGSFVYVTSVEDVLDEAGNLTGRATKVQVVDLTDPKAPALRGSVLLPEEVWPGYRYWYWGYGDEVVQVDGSTLAFHRYMYPWLWGGDCLDCGRPGPGGEPSNEHRIYVVDLADPDRPALASKIAFDDADWSWGLKAVGTTLYLSSYAAFLEGDQWYARYFLRRFDVADPASPVTLPGVNIPGMFVDAMPGTPYIYTLETWWDNGLQKSVTLLHSLAIDGEKAILQSTVEVPGYVNSVIVDGPAAFATTQWYEVLHTEQGDSWKSHSQLLAIDLSDPQALRLAGTAEVPRQWAYLQEVEGGRAFLGSDAGILTYLVTDIESLAFEQFFRTQGWSQSIVVAGEHAFVPSGYYGVQVLELGGG
ncbi:MAG: beta-propeller domain-containing protein [Planctomycetes bacterium]|nr:beta-propeller domain-containing protein [Planctomycetota bacterium]